MCHPDLVFKWSSEQTQNAYNDKYSVYNLYKQIWLSL